MFPFPFFSPKTNSIDFFIFRMQQLKPQATTSVLKFFDLGKFKLEKFCAFNNQNFNKIWQLTGIGVNFSQRLIQASFNRWCKYPDLLASRTLKKVIKLYPLINTNFFYLNILVVLFFEYTFICNNLVVNDDHHIQGYINIKMKRINKADSRQLRKIKGFQ